ncbi:MAG: ABC transporter substrate-binding protein [Planctomycetota bacterium]|nr:ABC transporter substrate-binding protein [Planctomycetota bacterium]
MGRLVWLPLALLFLAAGACGRDEESVPVVLKVVLHHGNNSRPYMPLPEEVAKQIKGALAPVGIEVEIRKVEWTPYLDMVQNGEHEMALLGWSADVPDADNFLHVLLHKDNARPGSANNISFYTSDEVSAKLSEARRIGDQARREVLYREAQEIIFRDVPMVPLVFTERIIAHRNTFAPIGLEPVTHPVLRRIAQPKDGTLIYLRGNDSKSLDPGDVTDGESSKVVEQVFDQLLRFKPGTVEVEPSLATGWTHDDDRKTWRFTIRTGVTFHDGTALDAAAVAGAFERQRDPAHPHHFDDGVWAYWKDLFGFVERVEVGGHAMEVVFRCSEAAPPFFLQMLAAFNASIPSPAALTKLGKEFRRKPVGTGPFAYADWRSGEEIKLVRNEAYWDGAPALASVLFRVSENPTIRSTRLLAGEQADLIDNIDPQTVAEIDAHPDATLVRSPGLNVGYLAMNTQKAPFNDPRVRQAIALALSKPRIVKFAYQGLAVPAATPVPPTIAGHHEGLVSPERDVAKARALLKAALGK